MNKKALLHLYFPDPGLQAALPKALCNDVDELWIETDVSNGPDRAKEMIRAAPSGKIVPVIGSSADVRSVVDFSSAVAPEEAAGGRIAIRLEKTLPFLANIPGSGWRPPSVCLVDDGFRNIERNDEWKLRRRLDETAAAVTALRKAGVRDLSVLLFHPDPVVQLNSNRYISKKVDVRTIAPLFLDSGYDTADDEEGFLVDSAVSLSPILCNGISKEILLRPAPALYLKEGAVQKAVQKAKLILLAMGLTPKTHEFISCPTCGRCLLDLSHTARSIKKQLEALISDLGPKKRLLEESGGITVAVMGCNVNGPGEAKGADIGVAGGKNRTGTIFRFGKPVKTVKEAEIVPEMIRGMKEVIEVKIGRAI